MTLACPEREFAVEVVAKLRSAGHVALFAGGCVRDMLLGRESKDYDVATTARPEEVRAIFGHRRTLAVGASFGVIVVLAPFEAGYVEVATFRTEGSYEDGRRPTSVAFCTPEEDARRRDFTINGMFFDPIDDRVLDFVGGQADLAARVIRAIGDPRDRVREDKLRMLRAVRFTSALNFSLDQETADAIRSMASELVVVSAERIAQELKKMLVDDHRRNAIELCESVGLLRVIFPELDSHEKRSDWTFTLKRLELLSKPSFELALAGLLKSLSKKTVASTICRRLKLSNDETERITWLVEHQHDLDDAPHLSMAALKRCLTAPGHEDLLQLMLADFNATSLSRASVDFCREFLASNPPENINPPPFVTGDDLIAMGMRPGPFFKKILETIRDAQLNLELTRRDEALAMAGTIWDASNRS